MFDIPITDDLRTSFAFSTKNRNGYLQRIPYPGASDFVEDPITSLKAAGYNNIGYGTEGGDNTYSLRGKVKWANGGRFRATVSADFTNVDTSQLANHLIKTFPFVFAGTYNCAIAASYDRLRRRPAPVRLHPRARRPEHDHRPAVDLRRQCRRQSVQRSPAVRRSVRDEQHRYQLRERQ